MSVLAIKGHAKRGKEVIEILEMFGGKNVANYDGSNTETFYFLNNIIICSSYGSGKLLGIDCYTLEEFLEEFPHKVGDKVLYKYDNTTYFIRKMFWENDKVLYELSDEVYSDGSSLPDPLIFNVGVTQLKPYKEETMDKANKAVFDANAQCCDIMNHIIKEETMEEIKMDIPKGYEFAGVDDDNQHVVFTKIQLEYPKTYEECCDVISRFAEYDFNKKRELLLNVNKLIKCRDAYWKIAGEQMGLGKPWEPDWTKDTEKYVVYPYQYLYSIDVENYRNTLLAFPTREMRDAFYENFKDLIEQCKELL